MGENQQTGQPAVYNTQASALTPQQQMQLMRLRGLQGAAMTPYQGSAPNGGASQGIAQLVASLLAKKKAQQLQQQWQTPPTAAPMTPPTSAPGAGTAAAAAPPDAGGMGPP